MDLDQTKQWLKIGNALAENEKAMEALASVKPVQANELIDRSTSVLLTYLVNEQAYQLVTDAIQASTPNVLSDLSALMANMAEQVQADVENMGGKLVELGFPDPRIDRANWRVIAIMVSADPDGMMEDIFEHAIAYHAKRQQVAKQLETSKEQPVAPVVVAVDPVAEDGLCSSSRVLTWGGVRYSLTPNQMAAVKVLHDAYSKGRPDVGLAEIKERCDSAALNESFAKVFQVKRNGEKSYNPVREVIESSSQGTYRLKDPKKV